MSGGITETPAVGIGKMLMDDQFVVPNHQRDYSWGVDEVEQLFDDIEGAAKKNTPIYFLGLMVFLRDRKRLRVLDGQQRLATIVIILAAIRGWLHQYSDHQGDAAKIQEWFIGRSELGQKDLEPRLTLNAANNFKFSEYVVKAVAPENIETAKNSLKRQDPNRRMLEAIIYAHQRIRTIAAAQPTTSEGARRLLDLVLYIRDRVSAVRLLVDSEEAAFTIFETLNDRGLDLSPLDLIKNHLFRSADTMSSDQVRDLEQRWAQMMATLSNVSADTFLRVFWISRHGRIRSTNLFDAFKRQYATPEAAVELSIAMQEASEHYAALESADDPVWAPYPEAVRTSLRVLRLIGGQIMHPIIMSALVNFPAVEMDRLLRLLEILIVRYQLIGGGNTGRIESLSSVVARDIYSGSINTATAALQIFKEVYPSDDEFKNAFSLKQERNNARAQYYLRKLESEAIRADKGVMAQETQPGTLTVEHILPRNPGDEWSDVLAADEKLSDGYAFRLGNLCLLTQVNRELGRKSFDDKREVYEASTLITTKEVASYSSWTSSSIEARQYKLAKLAVSAWRFQ